MKGPFFVKEKEEFVPSDLCRECGWYDETMQSCIMCNCPFIPDYEENEEVTEEREHT